VLKKFFHEYTFKLVVAVAVTSTVAFVALINRLWPWPNAVLGGVLLLCGILYLLDRLGIGPSTKSRVRDWLDSSGYSIRTIHDSNEFHFVMTDNVGLRTSIIQADSHAPISVVSAGYTATPKQFAAFNGLDRSQQDRFWKNIRLELLRYRIAFSDLTLEGGGVALSDDMMVSRTLTGTEFLQRVLFVRSGARLYQELLAELDAIPQPVSVAVAVPSDQPIDPPAPAR
jgi:hypothetical protein